MPDPGAARSSGGAVVGGAGPRVAVVGAGALGGWLALWLCRRGARVTLLDAWGPGNSRSSSGGETRVLRGLYGRDGFYTAWTARALALWLEAEAAWGEPLFQRTGAIWLWSGDDSYARKSLPHLAAAGFEATELEVAAAAELYPEISFAGVGSVFHEPQAGYLAARRACRAVARAVAAAGGEVRRVAVLGSGAPLVLSDGSRLAADLYVFACGPWLASLFPELLGGRLLTTRQEVFYFGTPLGRNDRYAEGALPIWMDHGERIFYGIPGNHDRGFKVADDTRGEPFDPTDGDRTPSAAALERARRHLAHRFPGMAGAPLLEARVCQYANTPDGHLLLDRHPQAANVWLLGGGSGHAFKLAPALGEHAADLILSGGQPRPELTLARFAATSAASLVTQFTAGR
jgi:sarcosine oxidase